MARNVTLISVAYSLLLFSCTQTSYQVSLTTADSVALSKTVDNGNIANEGFERCLRFVNAWLDEADSVTGLIPRNLENDTDIWNAKDAAADNYPFMVLTTAITDQELFQGRMKEMLETETRLASRVDNLPDTYSFSKQDFQNPDVDLDDIMFGSSEYIKDGLLPLTEWLGPSSWSERMIAILDDMWKHAPIETEFGNIVSTNVEVNGEMLQTLSRIYWMTGDGKYLDWAIRLGDYYLLGNNHPTHDFESLRLRDHGCEIVSGLCELYATVSVAKPDKKQVYQRPLHEMLDRILEVGRNEHGLFYDVVNPRTGEILRERIADNFGYTLNGFYTVYLVDSIAAYREATLKALNSLNDHYRDFDWENGSADGYADAIEGTLNLYAREPVESAADWLDSQILVMWAMQQPDGIIEGWHGDGNFARTTIMYCLWKTQGITINAWRDDIRLGAAMSGEDLMISVTADADWQGKLIFDSPRHQTIMRMPGDWPRINQFPEWFTAHMNANYQLISLPTGESETFSGSQLNGGIEVSISKGVNQFILRTL